MNTSSSLILYLPSQVHVVTIIHPSDFITLQLNLFIIYPLCKSEALWSTSSDYNPSFRLSHNSTFVSSSASFATLRHDGLGHAHSATSITTIESLHCSFKLISVYKALTMWKQTATQVLLCWISIDITKSSFCEGSSFELQEYTTSFSKNRVCNMKKAKFV